MPLKLVKLQVISAWTLSCLLIALIITLLLFFGVCFILYLQIAYSSAAKWYLRELKMLITNALRTQVIDQY